MDLNMKAHFTAKWAEYFYGADLPFVFYYSDRSNDVPVISKPSGHQCLIGVLNKVRRGVPLCFNADSIGCGGGKRYLGYAKKIMPDFKYFLSCGIEGGMEGERYKKTPEIVTALMDKMPEFKAPAKYIIFKRWDQLTEEDHPEVVIFFAYPDLLSGLFTLAGFEEDHAEAVIAPFAAGCGSIVLYPYLEKQNHHQRAVIGMFDVSARPYIGRNELSFAIPMEKFERMIGDMDESFLITPSWEKVKNRLMVLK